VFHPPGPSSLISQDMKPSVPIQSTPQQQYYPPPPLPRRNDPPSHMSRSSSMMSMNSQPGLNHQHFNHYNDLGLPPSRSNSIQQIRSNDEQQPHYHPPEPVLAHQPPPLPTRNNSMIKEPSPSISSSTSMTSNNSSRKASICEDKENNGDLEASTMALQAEKAKQEKISVKERTKTFNRMASEVSITNSISNLMKQNIGHHDLSKKRKSSSRASRGASSHRDDVDSHDSSSISTLDQAVKQWMVASAKGDYLTLVKMLRDDPRLTKAKDFTSGYTALHWAAKQGNLDLVKLLAGNYSANVNIRSHGGYTPLHLACQFDHQEVFDVLVKAYGADPNMRDNSGKKPRQYMSIMSNVGGFGLHNLSNDTFRQLKDRRRHRSRQLADKNSGGILRFGSLSVKVKKTTEAFNNYFNSEKKHSNSDQPYSLPTIGLPNDEDAAKMPPPKFAPIKKRRSKRAIDFASTLSKSAPVTPNETSPIKEEERCSDSDGEYGFDSQWTTNRL